MMTRANLFRSIDRIAEPRHTSAARRSVSAMLCGLCVLAASLFVAPHAGAQPLAEGDAAPDPFVRLTRTISEWNLQISGRSRIGLKGFDPVSYFPEGGGEPVRGEPNFSVSYRAVTYFFKTIENRDRFADNPNRYEPAFGGWCAWAMSRGDKTDIDPNSFIVRDDRLYVFYKGLFGDTRKDWLRGNHDQLSQKADANWRSISDEGPRRFPVLPDEPEEAEGDANTTVEADADDEADPAVGPVVDPDDGG